MNLGWFANARAADVDLSLGVYKPVAFSSQYWEDGALIMNVDYSSVAKLIPQIEDIYDIELEDRKEAHITLLTPPEAQGWFASHGGTTRLISTAELHKRYKDKVQKLEFTVKCIGSRASESGNRVFFLVVESQGILDVRKEIKSELEARSKFAGIKVPFDPEAHWPHITIGYVGSDVHGVSKGEETCIPSINLNLSEE